MTTVFQGGDTAHQTHLPYNLYSFLTCPVSTFCEVCSNQVGLSLHGWWTYRHLVMATQVSSVVWSQGSQSEPPSLGRAYSLIIHQFFFESSKLSPVFLKACGQKRKGNSKFNEKWPIELETPPGRESSYWLPTASCRLWISMLLFTS